MENINDFISFENHQQRSLKSIQESSRSNNRFMEMLWVWEYVKWILKSNKPRKIFRYIKGKLCPL